jgi:hypothetical protein
MISRTTPNQLKLDRETRPSSAVLPIWKAWGREGRGNALLPEAIVNGRG